MRYRIAYVAFCLEDSARGRAFGQARAGLTAVDPALVQYGSADWFWEQWPDSFALQVEPREHRFKDQAMLTADEARRTQQARDPLLRRAPARACARSAPDGRDSGLSAFGGASPILTASRTAMGDIERRVPAWP